MANSFIIQNRAIGIVLRWGPRGSCREELKNWKYLRVSSLYIYALMLFAVKNLNIHQTNSSPHTEHNLGKTLLSTEKCLLFIC